MLFNDQNELISCLLNRKMFKSCFDSYCTLYENATQRFVLSDNNFKFFNK